MAVQGIPPTEAELITRALESRLGDVYTAMPGIVQSYDPATQTADVLPGIQRAVTTTEDDIAYEDLPIVPNVKVCFPRGGPFQISWPLNKGDSVILICTTYAIQQWRQGDNSQTVAPGDLRLHSLGSAFALPSLAIDSAAIPNAQASQNAFIIQGPLIILGDQATPDFAAKAAATDNGFSAIANAFAACTPGPMEPGLTSLKSALSTPPASVACERVKIK